MLDDVYFDKDYINLYINKESTLLDFSFSLQENVFSNKTIKNRISSVGNVNMQERGLYDAESAYGYGGYLTNSTDLRFVNQAIEEYSGFCVQQKIVAEFIRFLPFNKFPDQFPGVFDFIIPDRKTVYIDLSLTKEERWLQYDANTRNILRKAEKTLTLERTEDIDLFMEMYYETMKRNQADEFYFFDAQYFKKLMKLNGTRLYQVKLGDEVVCSSFVLNGKDIAHYHLSANRTEYLKLNGNYFLLDNLFEAARAENKKFFHLGGGRTAQENDSLLLFKKKFSKNTLTFYIAGKVFMRDAYQELCERWQQQTEKKQKYFLKYRLPL
jgi:hypothetical protein